jgi:hypothetical protein
MQDETTYTLKRKIFRFHLLITKDKLKDGIIGLLQAHNNFAILAFLYKTC